VRAYYQEFERANRTADPSVLKRDFYDAACQPCNENLSVLEADRRKQQHIEGYEFVLHKLDASELRGRSVVVDLIAHHAAGRIVRDRDRAVLEELRRTPVVQSVLHLVRVSDGWRIVHVTSLGEVNP